MGAIMPRFALVRRLVPAVVVMVVVVAAAAFAFALTGLILWIAFVALVALAFAAYAALLMFWHPGEWRRGGASSSDSRKNGAR